MAFDSFPFVLSWELTMACNLRCLHCASTAGSARRDELTPEESLRICDQLPGLLVREVAFTGGEPLLNPAWPIIAERLERLGICTQIITNGILLSESVVGRMMEAGIDAIGVSLDGLEPTHDRIRGCQGMFQRVAAGIERVLSAGLPLTVITTANALNVAELPLLLACVKSLGVSRWQIQPIFPLGRTCQFSELKLTAEAYLILGRFVLDYESKAKADGLKIELADSYGYGTEFDSRHLPWRGCPAGLVSCGITSDGKVKGCLSLPDEVTEGDLRKGDFWDIWFAPEAFAYTRQFSAAEVGPSCRHCDRIDLCRGGCSAMSYGSTGRFHNDPYCFQAITTTGPHAPFAGSPSS